MMDIFGFNKIETRPSFYGTGARKDHCSKLSVCPQPGYLQTRDNTDTLPWNSRIHMNFFSFLSR